MKKAKCFLSAIPLATVLLLAVGCGSSPAATDIACHGIYRRPYEME